MQRGQLVNLYLAGCEQRRGVEIGEHAVGGAYRVVERRLQFAGGQRIAPGEFAGAVALVGLAGDAADDPLPGIAGKVQHEIADGVLDLVRAAPDLLLAELGETGFDAAPPLFELMAGDAQEFLSNGHVAAALLRWAAVTGSAKSRSAPGIG